MGKGYRERHDLFVDNLRDMCSLYSYVISLLDKGLSFTQLSAISELSVLRCSSQAGNEHAGGI